MNINKSIEPILSYGFKHNEHNYSLTLIVGVVAGYEKSHIPFNMKLLGCNIPLPVRSNTWFEPAMGIEGMVKVLSGYGYALKNKTVLKSGVVYQFKN